MFLAMMLINTIMGLVTLYIGIRNTREVMGFIKKYFTGDDVWVSDVTRSRLYYLHNGLFIENLFKLNVIDRRSNIPHPTDRTTYTGNKLYFSIAEDVNNILLFMAFIFVVAMFINSLLPLWIVVLIYIIKKHSENMFELENINRLHMGVPEIKDTKVSEKLRKFFNIN